MQDFNMAETAGQEIPMENMEKQNSKIALQRNVRMTEKKIVEEVSEISSSN